MSSLQDRLLDLFVEAVAELDQRGIQPTSRQVAKAFGQGEWFASRTLRQCYAAGLLTSGVERITQANGNFTVYRLPANPPASRARA